jgi:hypothetical protein
VRCIKPNPEKSSSQFALSMVAMQLRCAGVVEAIRVSRSAYPYKLTHAEFLDDFAILSPTGNDYKQHAAKPGGGGGGLREACESVMQYLRAAAAEAEQSEAEAGVEDDAGLPLWKRKKLEKKRKERAAAALLPVCRLTSPDEYQLGRSRVYFQQGSLDKLSARKARVTLKSRVLLQRVARGYVCRARYTRMRAAAVPVQSAWRGYSRASWFHRVRHACILGQALQRGSTARRRVLSIRRSNAAVAIQKVGRGKNVRVRAATQARHRIRFQALIRGWMARKMVRGMKEEKARKDDLQGQLDALRDQMQKQQEEAQRQLAKKEKEKREALAAEAEAAVQRLNDGGGDGGGGDDSGASSSPSSSPPPAHRPLLRKQSSVIDKVQLVQAQQQQKEAVNSVLESLQSHADDLQGKLDRALDKNHELSVENRQLRERNDTLELKAEAAGARAGQAGEEESALVKLLLSELNLLRQCIFESACRAGSLSLVSGDVARLLKGAAAGGGASSSSISSSSSRSANDPAGASAAATAPNSTAANRSRRHSLRRRRQSLEKRSTTLPPSSGQQAASANKVSGTGALFARASGTPPPPPMGRKRSTTMSAMGGGASTEPLAHQPVPPPVTDSPPPPMARGRTHTMSGSTPRPSAPSASSKRLSVRGAGSSSSDLGGGADNGEHDGGEVVGIVTKEMRKMVGGGTLNF